MRCSECKGLSAAYSAWWRFAQIRTRNGSDAPLILLLQNPRLSTTELSNVQQRGCSYLTMLPPNVVGPIHHMMIPPPAHHGIHVYTDSVEAASMLTKHLGPHRLQRWGTELGTFLPYLRIQHRPAQLMPARRAALPVHLLPYPQNNRASGSYTVHCGP